MPQRHIVVAVAVVVVAAALWSCLCRSQKTCKREPRAEGSQALSSASFIVATACRDSLNSTQSSNEFTTLSVRSCTNLPPPPVPPTPSSWHFPVILWPGIHPVSPLIYLVHFVCVCHRPQSYSSHERRRSGRIQFKTQLTACHWECEYILIYIFNMFYRTFIKAILRSS